MIEYAQQGKFFLREYSYFHLAVFSRDFFEQSKYENFKKFLWKRSSMKIRILLQKLF